MKRYGNLYPQITDFSNLVLAARQAQRGKRFRENVLKFNYNLEAELAKIKSELGTCDFSSLPVNSTNQGSEWLASLQ